MRRDSTGSGSRGAGGCDVPRAAKIKDAENCSRGPRNRQRKSCAGAEEGDGWTDGGEGRIHGSARGLGGGSQQPSRTVLPLVTLKRQIFAATLCPPEEKPVGPRCRLVCAGNPGWGWGLLQSVSLPRFLLPLCGYGSRFQAAPANAGRSVATGGTQNGTGFGERWPLCGGRRRVMLMGVDAGPGSFPGALRDVPASRFSLWNGFFGKRRSERGCNEGVKDCTDEGM